MKTRWVATGQVKTPSGDTYDQWCVELYTSSVLEENWDFRLRLFLNNYSKTWLDLNVAEGKASSKIRILFWLLVNFVWTNVLDIQVHRGNTMFFSQTFDNREVSKLVVPSLRRNARIQFTYL